jgi:glutathione S-transferase
VILHDHVLSAEGYAVRLALALAGVPHGHRVVDILADPTAPPVVEAGGVRLSGPAAILAKVGEWSGDPGWTTGDGTAGQDVRDWLAFAETDLAAALRLREARLFDRPADLAGLARRAAAAFRALDDHVALRLIEGSPFLVSDRPTIADVACFPAPALHDDVGIPLDRFPALARFVDAMTRRPGFLPMPGILVLPDSGG